MNEKSACGVGFVVSRKGEADHEIVRKGLEALRRVEHRGATASDGLTGDGAGLMTDIPFEILGYKPGTVAVGCVFVSDPEPERQRALLSIFEDTFAFWGMKVLKYRDVPVDASVLGPIALKAMPKIFHAIIQRPEHCSTDASFDKLLYTAKQQTLTRQRNQLKMEPAFYLPSLSVKTIVYKAMTTSELLDKFYLDLQNPLFKSRFAMFHRRFSTNTVSSWDKAQPFRLIAHNGEINTIAGNRSWGYSCEKSIGLPKNELLTHDGISDSGSVNEMVEALMYRSSLPHVEDCLALMIPPADPPNTFYKFWGRAMEPWDGPALMTFCNGSTIGARLDRNGFRPCRWAYTDDHFYLASEAGAFDIDESAVLQKGALRGGRGVAVKMVTGKIDFRDPSQANDNFDAKFDARLIYFPYRSPVKMESRLDQKFLFNFTDEEMSKILTPMVVEGKEPIGSMGDTARVAALSTEPRSFYDYFYQNFAQVTNPPLDYLREKMVTDLSVYLGRRPNIFAKKELIPPRPALELPGPVLSLGQLEYLEKLADATSSDPHIRVRKFDMIFNRAHGVVGMQTQLDAIASEAARAVESGVSVVILSDAAADWNNLPIPALIALRAVIRALNVAGVRLKVSLVIDSGQIRTTHHVAATIGFGASAVCPRTALQLAREAIGSPEVTAETKERNLIKALESGLLKVMSKMGISVVRSYQGSKLFTIIGLDKDLCARFFRGVPSLLGGPNLEGVTRDILAQADLAEKAHAAGKLLSTYQLREHPRGQGGEKHSMTTTRSRAVHKLVRDTGTPLTSMELYDAYLKLGFEDEPVNVRHLLALKKSNVPLDLKNVQPSSDITRKFGSGAMSFGAISAEAQRDIILAMKEVGGRSNSGEGGENPYYFTHGISASTKQIASARFGVTAEYLIAGNEFQIKMAQGAKPGEGGQLMAPKVNEDIARARHSMPRVDLISPPPMHDIYSIEDLKQLIFELKQIKPTAKVSVKLVSGANVGTIAVGVAKAGADIVHIAGNDGGTGAATVSSMKHAGLPFEFGLIEAHHALIQNGLRDKVVLRTDGGIHSGKDIVMAALMGAQEFDFGKLLLVAQGCVMARVCEKNTCPSGIATHDPKVKEKYKGTKDHIVKLLSYIAEDVRRNLASMGARSLEEITGRSDLLQINERHIDLIKNRNLDLSFALRPPLPLAIHEPSPAAVAVSPLNRKIVTDCMEAIESDQSVTLTYPISTADRAVLATLSGVLASKEVRTRYTKQISLNFHGSAGQGFGVFLTGPVYVRLRGEANDSVCKTMSAGKVVVCPPEAARYKPEENTIIGNCALYGATGGTLYVNGVAGDRFAVRNSGAVAVVEGAGLHACEYMTNGVVAILGPTLANVGSGMTGGTLYLFGDPENNVNREFLTHVPLLEEDETRLMILLQDYFAESASPLAQKILSNWETARTMFRKFLPKNLVTEDSFRSAAVPLADAPAITSENVVRTC